MNRLFCMFVYIRQICIDEIQKKMNLLNAIGELNQRNEAERSSKLICCRFFLKRYQDRLMQIERYPKGKKKKEKCHVILDDKSVVMQQCIFLEFRYRLERRLLSWLDFEIVYDRSNSDPGLKPGNSPLNPFRK